MHRSVTLAIILVSALLGVMAAWRAPGVDRYARDWLMRARGPLAAPADIAIVSIDERSIARYGRFPWQRSVMAKAIDAVAAAGPKAIALDVLYADATSPDQDGALSQSIGRAGNVVVAAQLIESGTEAQWLSPLPGLRETSAAVGHVNVHTESEGIARELPIRVADDEGNVVRAMPVETIRVGERLPESAVVDQPGAVVLGKHRIPVSVAAQQAVIEASGPSSSQPIILRAGRMAIEYIGPAGSFTTYSLADVAEGRVPAERLRNTYVLIGATAASLGDRISAPFTHYDTGTASQHGGSMPGIEVLANSLNTILRGRYYSEVSDWVAFAWAALIAAATIGLLGLAQGGRELPKQVAALAAVGALVLLGCWIAFTEGLLYPPVTSQMVSFASAGVLGLLRRSVATRTELDRAIATIAGADRLLAAPRSSMAEAIGRVVDARGVAIERAVGGGRFETVAAWGEVGPAQYASAYDVAGGRLLIAGGTAPDASTLRALIALAQAQFGEHERETPPAWPEGLEARARVLRGVNERLVDNSRFVDLAMRSVQDGLVVTGPDGRIAFANPGAAAVLEATAEALAGQDLLERIAHLDSRFDARETLRSLLVDRVAVEREIESRSRRSRRYVMRIAPVASSPEAAITGLVASFSDVTRQAELQQTKNDVISLVSHEMRTPLTAIQGMSELLASYEIPEDRRREMNLAINDEVKRLTRMITQYLDITRLESGATVLRPAPVRLEQLIDRVMLMQGPAAGAREIRLEKDIAVGLPGLVGDADLLFRVLENLVSNAIKYSPPETAVTIFARATSKEALIEVRDRGRGIPAEDVSRIFEKFYRVPRPEDAEVPGTGLGLSLVREIVELHGGSVCVQSEVNAGSVFTVCLPLAGPPSNFVKS